MAITTKTQAAIINGQVAAMQASNSGLLDFSVGSVLLAIAQAVAGVALWLQAIALQLSTITRAATSTGADLDSFVNDFGVFRLPAIAASGSAIFSRFSTGAQVVIQSGDIVETADGSQQFIVSVDTTNANYSASLGGYIMGPTVASINVPVAATLAGAAGNVVAGAVNTITGSIPGVDTVANVSPLTNGADAESDPALRSRFVAYINSRALATPSAVEYAIASVQQGITFKLVENYAYDGTFQPGYFYVVVDDGSGAPPSSLITAVENAINAVRPLTAEFGVFSPVLEPVTVSMTISGGSASVVQSAIEAYIAAADLGGSVLYARLSQIAFDASNSVTNVTSVLLNGGVLDLNYSAQQKPVVASVTVNQI